MSLLKKEPVRLYFALVLQTLGLAVSKCWVLRTLASFLLFSSRKAIMAQTGTIPYIGCRISLISKSGFRYEGFLYNIDTKESTVALQNGWELFFKTKIQTKIQNCQCALLVLKEDEKMGKISLHQIIFTTTPSSEALTSKIWRWFFRRNPCSKTKRPLFFLL